MQCFTSPFRQLQLNRLQTSSTWNVFQTTVKCFDLALVWRCLTCQGPQVVRIQVLSKCLFGCFRDLRTQNTGRGANSDIISVIQLCEMKKIRTDFKGFRFVCFFLYLDRNFVRLCAYLNLEAFISTIMLIFRCLDRRAAAVIYSSSIN